MKQGKTLAELGRELQRQRLNRQDFLADTRSLEMESNNYGSTLHLSLDGKTCGFGTGDLAHQQIAARLNIPFCYYQKMQNEVPELLDIYETLLDFYSFRDLESFRAEFDDNILLQIYNEEIALFYQY